MAIEAWQVPLWDAINRYVVSCGGDPDKHVYGNTTRQKAVADVCDVVRQATASLLSIAEAAKVFADNSAKMERPVAKSLWFDCLALFRALKSAGM